MLTYAVGICSKNHKNLVVKDRADATDRDIAALKRQAKAYGVYFNHVAQCYVCKEPFAGDSPNITVERDDPATCDAAAVAIHTLLKGN